MTVLASSDGTDFIEETARVPDEFLSARFGDWLTRHNHAKVGVLLFFLISFDCRCKATRRDIHRSSKYQCHSY